jgi:rubrerythrin
MTHFMLKSFSVGMGGNDEFRDSWDRIFGDRSHDQVACPVCGCTWNVGKYETCPWCDTATSNKEGIGY